MRESTRNIFRLHGKRVDRAVHNYIYFRYYAPYVKTMLVLIRFFVRYFRWMSPLRFTLHQAFQRYHAKVLSFGDVRKILTIDRDVTLGPDSGRSIIPYSRANSIILKEPGYIAVMDCPCKLAREPNTCEPVASCIAVGRTTAQFWLEHGEKYHARRITQEEALSIITDFRRRGHVTTAFFKVATGGRTGVICNCCPRCCVSLEATRLARSVRGGGTLSMQAPSGYEIRHIPERCRLCGACGRICPFGAIKTEGGTWSRDSHLCMGCGLCEEHCDNGALEMHTDGAGLQPLDLDRAAKLLGSRGTVK